MSTDENSGARFKSRAEFGKEMRDQITRRIIDHKIPAKPLVKVDTFKSAGPVAPEDRALVYHIINDVYSR